MNLVHRRHGRPGNTADEFFNAFFQAPVAPRADRWAPAVDVVETDADYRFAVELPGVTRDGVDRIELARGPRDFLFERRDGGAEFLCLDLVPLAKGDVTPHLAVGALIDHVPAAQWNEGNEVEREKLRRVE